MTLGRKFFWQFCPLDCQIMRNIGQYIFFFGLQWNYFGLRLYKEFSTFFKTESGRVFLIYIKTYPRQIFPEMHLGKEHSIFFLELLELKTRQVFPTTCYVSGWLSWGFFWGNSFKHVVLVALCAENYRICHEKWYLPVQRNILGKKWEALKICATFGLPEKISRPLSKLLFYCPNEYFGKKPNWKIF